MWCSMNFIDQKKVKVVLELLLYISCSSFGSRDAPIPILGIGQSWYEIDQKWRGVCDDSASVG